ncbi:MAG: HNH endonuclease, partial [Anaerolineae bacterium]|nr:HNH endonuclease [Anaerolineae bacterium]
RRDYPRPSVIRIGYMVKRPRPRVRLTKREVFRRDDYTCQYCGSRARTLTLDHIVPRHRGGRHRWENLVAACASCN